MKSKGILALVGSGEFTNAMEETDKFLLAQIRNPVVAIIPTAAGQEEDYDKWIKDGITHFEKIGAEVFGIHLTKKEDADKKEVLDQLKKANFFYFSGGDPGYLLDILVNSKAWELILEKYRHGAIVAGSSAGAMVMGEVVLARIYNFYRMGHSPKWEKGLNIVPFGVIPHFNKIGNDLNPHQKEEVMEHFPKDPTIIGIDEDTAYILIEGKWQVMGHGEVHIPAFPNKSELS